MQCEAALAKANKIGASRAEGLPLLAMACSLIQFYAGPGASPKLVYDGARKSGVDAKALLKLTPREVGDLMWL